MNRLVVWFKIQALDAVRFIVNLRPTELFFLLALLTSLAGYNLWQYFPEEVAFYGKCTALSILLWVYAYYRLTSRHRWAMKCITEVASWWALVNCMDELFFDPYTKTFIEFFFAALTAVFVYLKYKNYLWVQRLQRWARKL
jgi:hypothetical protein